MHQQKQQQQLNSGSQLIKTDRSYSASVALHQLSAHKTHARCGNGIVHKRLSTTGKQHLCHAQVELGTKRLTVVESK